MAESKNIGIDVKKPGKSCTDKKCPFHGEITLRGKMFTGVVLARDTHRSATVEWTYTIFIPKFERSETRRTKIHVHNPPCIDAEIGDIVKIAETKPLSKTKNFVIIENLGKEKGFIEKMAARQEAKVKEKEEKVEIEESQKAKKKAAVENEEKQPVEVDE
jgi:small subunit ribosomal protein S17